MRLCIICGLPLGKKKSCPRCKEIKDKNGECLYCKSIYESTTASPKKKFKYCPMCATEIDKSKMKKWGRVNENYKSR